MRHHANQPNGLVPHAAGIGGTLLLALSAASVFVLSPLPATLASGVFMAATGLVLYLAAGAGLARRFGAANSVTLLRLALGCILVGTLFDGSSRLVDSGLISAIAVSILVLDGLDGWLARRFGTETAFGGRFDMEVDAAVIAVLSALAWASGRADAWVLLLGAMRYGFVAAGMVYPWLKAPLPPRLRRRLVCVAQMLALAFGLAPGTADQASMVLALALTALILSFALDVAWLARHGRRAVKTGKA